MPIDNSVYIGYYRLNFKTWSSVTACHELLTSLWTVSVYQFTV